MMPRRLRLESQAASRIYLREGNWLSRQACCLNTGSEAGVPPCFELEGHLR